jgi:hypothetical protein
MGVSKRGAALLLSVGLLCTVGSAFRKPCCPLIELDRSTPSLSGDCCQDPICCETEKKSPAPATLTAHGCLARTSVAMTVLPVHPIIPTASLVAPAPRQPHLAFAHSPPQSSRNPQALLSVFRV